MKTKKGFICESCKTPEMTHDQAMEHLGHDYKEPPHTPTPWTVGETIGRGKTQVSALVNGKPIGICSTYRAGIETDPEADAAFIVRAVNTHEELLQALRDTYAHFEGHFGKEEWCISESAKTIAQAIAKAEGK